MGFHGSSCGLIADVVIYTQRVYRLSMKAYVVKDAVVYDSV